MPNSLSEEDLYKNIIPQINLYLGYKNIIVIIVEGKNDKKLLEKMFNDNTVKIIPSGSGENKLEDIVNNKFKDKDRVIAIRDKDYNETSSSEKVYFYDYNSSEIMMISNDDTFKSICSEYYSDCGSYDSLRTRILSNLKVISILRIKNSKFQNEEDKISFSGLSFGGKWDSIKNRLLAVKVLEQLEEHNKNKIMKKSIIVDIIKELKTQWTLEEYLYNTQGHDFMKLFAIICSNTEEGSNVKEGIATGTLRAAFKFEDFKKTNLYKRLLLYSKNKQINMF